MRPDCWPGTCRGCVGACSAQLERLRPSLPPKNWAAGSGPGDFPTMKAPSPEQVAQRLRVEFGVPARRRRSAFWTLIGTILSQQTSAANTRAALERLRQRFPNPRQLAEASVAEIEQQIRPAGLARQRAQRIKLVVEQLAQRDRSLRLGFLRRMSDEEAMEFLLRLPGVGPKTAACVLLFALGRQVFPVDVHILRIAKRLGWLPAGAGAEDAHEVLGKFIPPELRHELHINLIALGRTYCRPRWPRCGECPLSDICPRLLDGSERRNRSR